MLLKRAANSTSRYKHRLSICVSSTRYRHTDRETDNERGFRAREILGREEDDRVSRRIVFRTIDEPARETLRRFFCVQKY